MENLTEEPTWLHAAPAPNPASVTLESSFTELSRIIHVSNQHTLNSQRSKTEHEGKLDGKFANMQEIHAGLCLQLAAAQAAEAAFVCFCSSVLQLLGGCGFSVASREGRQAGRSLRVHGKKLHPGAWSSPGAGIAMLCPRHPATCRQTY